MKPINLDFMKKSTIFSMIMLLMAWLMPFSAHAANPVGDVNSDNEVNIADVNALIDIILDGNGNNVAADVNGDHEVNIADVNTLIDIILGGSVPAPSLDYVDLGLPSGTLWATRNVGAIAPEEYGGYFAWGETEPKENYAWSTYKWSEGNEWSLTKYKALWDNEIELELADDAAYVNWGPAWRMPSQAQMEELCNCCSWQWTTLNGVNGQLVTGPNGNTMFLPAAGFRSNSSLSQVGNRGRYWARTVEYISYQYAYYLGFDSGSVHCLSYIYGRNYGFAIRPVRVSPADEQPLRIVQHSLDLGTVTIEDTHTDDLTIINDANEAMTLTVTADEPFEIKRGNGSTSSRTVVVPGNSITSVTVMFTADTPGDFNGNVTVQNSALYGGQTVIPVHASAIIDDFSDYEYVDLGLPSHTLWATMNVGANAPEEYGNYFAWGETAPKDYYAWSTYKWFASGANHSGFTKYCTFSDEGYNGFTDSKKELEPADDAATINWGPNWHMPSATQIDELNKKCSWTWTQMNGVYGNLVTGPNGRTMFLPAAGFYVGGSRRFAGSDGDGDYWSRTLAPESSGYAGYMSFYSESWYWYYYMRFYGHTVRAVRVPQN